MNLSKLLSIIQAAITTEETFVPVFVHNPASGTIAAIVIAAESAVEGVLAAFVPQAPQPKS